MKIDFANPTDYDKGWLHSINMGIKSVLGNTYGVPRFEGTVVFSYFLKEAPYSDWDEDTRALKSLTEPGPARDAMKARIAELSKEFLEWMRASMNAEYDEDVGRGTPVTPEKRIFLEAQYKKRVEVMTSPDFFDKEVSPIVQFFYDERLKYSEAAFKIAGILGMPVSEVQSLISESDGSSLVAGDGTKMDYSFES